MLLDSVGAEQAAETLRFCFYQNDGMIWEFQLKLFFNEMMQWF